ncbi:MAG: hypothetical protein JWQ13_3418 [Ramlibacter sp.]|jgi:hypothetical protein|nr:hypothetical protein [Ramlibacter sp.]
MHRTQISSPAVTPAAPVSDVAARAQDGGEAAVAQPGADGDGQLTTLVSVFAGALLVGGAGLIVERRRRLARRVAPAADVVPASALTPDPVPVETPPADAALTEEAAHATATEAAAWEPTVETAPPHPSSVFGVRAQKRLIACLMWVRTVMGAAALLAAIAIFVFWAIETTDLRAGETGLNLPLVVLMLSGWAASWVAGRLANMLHRFFFGRVHPKFDD